MHSLWKQYFSVLCDFLQAFWSQKHIPLLSTHGVYVWDILNRNTMLENM